MRVRALFVDLDGAPLEPVLNSGLPKPHIVVESSPGKFHVYWLVADVAPKDFTACQKALAERCNGDDVSDPPRVMRLPGFIHRKGAPFRSRIVSIRKAPPYQISKLGLENVHNKNIVTNISGGERFMRLAAVNRELGPKSAAQQLNDAAIADYAAWVPEIFPKAKRTRDGGYRVASKHLGRKLEEDISFHPEGIKDFGVHDIGDPLQGKRSPIDIVMEWVFDADPSRREDGPDFQQAFDWLRERFPAVEADAPFGTNKKDEADSKIVAKPYEFPAEETLEMYDWMLGWHLLRGEVAGTVASGGTGKSTLAIVEALTMSSGQRLLHDKPPVSPLRIVLVNLEDSKNTMDKRIAAAMRHYQLEPDDIGGRLIVLCKGEVAFKVAGMIKGEAHCNMADVCRLRDFMLEHQADVLSIDSFIRTHSVNENDNSAIQEVVEAFESIAQQANCAVHLWHHTRKGDGGASLDSARGAKAFVDACRSVRVLETMTAEHAEMLKEHLDVEQYKQYFRAFSGKRNFAPDLDASEWYFLDSVVLNNGPPNCPMDGDSIGVVTPWTMPKDRDLTPEDCEAIKQAVGAAEWREDARAEMWVGKAIAPIVRLDANNDRAQLKRMVKKLTDLGILKAVPGKKADRKPCLLIVPGEAKI